MGTEFGMRWSGPFNKGLQMRGRQEENEPRGWAAGFASCLRYFARSRAEEVGVGVTTYVLDGFEFWYFGVPRDAPAFDWIPRESVRKRWDRLRMFVARYDGAHVRAWYEQGAP